LIVPRWAGWLNVEPERRNMKVGDTVRFSSKWLRSTGQIVGEIPFMRGVIVHLGPLFSGKAVATVEFNWLNAHGPNAHIDPPQRMKALTSNLEIVKGVTT